MKITPNPLSQNAMRRVRKMRTDRGWSNAQFAVLLEEAGTSITLATLQNYDAGRRRDMTVDELFAFAEVLGTTATALVAATACETCQGTPPPGFECRTCGATAEVEAK